MPQETNQPPVPPLLPPLFTAPPLRTEPDPLDVVTTWLAGAHPKPKSVLRYWEEGCDQLLPLGARFAAVRIPGRIMHTAVRSSDTAAVAAVARDTLRGPVIAGTYARERTYWALVPWRAHVYWPDYLTDTPYLGPGSYLNVPPPTCTVPPIYWVTRPRYRYDLCTREQVFNLIIRGRQQEGGTR
ncbi:hypothetical protein [Streptomyces sp. NPDC059597]|uniref:hypothetical protein n=1 Tax=Streptomyces sp. NPDC059597 TaxID=3346879 RepID=UPI0036B3CD7E